MMTEKSTKNAVLDRHIVIDPEICHGKPHLAGHRIRVHDIAVWHERLGLSVAEICADYELSLAEVHAALYYFDYKAAALGLPNGKVSSNGFSRPIQPLKRLLRTVLI